MAARPILETAHLNIKIVDREVALVSGGMSRLLQNIKAGSIMPQIISKKTIRIRMFGDFHKKFIAMNRTCNAALVKTKRFLCPKILIRTDEMKEPAALASLSPAKIIPR